MLKIFVPVLICAFIFNWGETLLFTLFLGFIFLLKKPSAILHSYINFELDYFSWGLILLTFWIIIIAIMARTSNKNRSKKRKAYLFIIISMIIRLILTFTVSRVIIFYLIFETCLIPILIIILGWGYQPERIQAGVYLLLYTIFGSLPLLIAVLQAVKLSGTSYMGFMSNSLAGILRIFCLFAAFLVKFPIYGVHLWLLKAHVEAPVAGSIILAGVLLKLGGLGLIRVFPLLNIDYYIVKELIISIRVWGGVLVRFNCLRYTDIKLLIASSSVVHISTCVAALFIITDWGVKGALLIILAHGVCSSGLFFLANTAYERTNRRSILVSKGLLNLAPIITLWWFLLLAANIAAPPTINLAREIMLLISLIRWRHLAVPLLVLLTFFSVIYRIYLFSLSQHGVFNKTKRALTHRSSLELTIGFLHWAPLNIIIFNMRFIFCFNSLNKTLFCENRDIRLFKTLNLINNVYKIFCLLTGLIITNSLIMAVIFIYQDATIILDWEIIRLNSAAVTIRILIDWITLIFLSTVILITASICLFSAYYIRGDTNKTRFIILLILFVASIVCLIISPNIIRILLGWDGLGLTSYILVIYYQNERSCNAGILTILRNRIGDVCILITIAIISYEGTWNFFCIDIVQYKIIYFFIMVAGITKRAQIPFSAWLPAAMAAPTPVSALVHSSTLVTAGVYLIVRFFHILKDSVLLQILLIVSVITILIAGWGANFETDLKKIVALSTLRQLGLIIIILRIGIKNVAFFHMVSHAIFKSTLFMSAGVIIHISNRAQDTRLIGGLNTSSPTLITIFSVINLSLLGFPFLSGFFSKDLSLELTISNLYNIFILTLIVVATGITVSYSLRVIYLAVTNSANNKRSHRLEDRETTVITSMCILFFMGILTGYLFSWLVIWTPCALVITALNKYYILCVILISGVVILLCLSYKKCIKSNLNLTLFVSRSRKIWNLPFLRTNPPIKLVLIIGLVSSQLIDKGWLEAYPPKTIAIAINYYRAIIQKIQTTVIVSAYLITFSLLFIFALFYYLHNLYRVLYWSYNRDIVCKYYKYHVCF